MKNSDYYVHVTLTPDQARTLVDALDVYSRIHIGQFHRVREEFWGKLEGRESVERMEKALNEARAEAFPELAFGPNQSHSMSSPRVEEVGKVAWDILQVVRSTAAWAANPEGGIQVSFDTPMFLSESVPRPTAKITTILDRLADV